MDKKYIIFTDLDGTLLDHHDYSFEAASEALALIKTKDIPLVIITSKTFEEVKKLQTKLDISTAFIVENGAGIYIPSGCDLAKGDWHKNETDWIKLPKAKSYLESRLFLNSVKEKYSLKGFGDMQLEEVMELTGLNEEHAKDAHKRDFTEPFIMGDSLHLSDLKLEANSLGFDIIKGGRFFHLITLGQDKAKAMLDLKVLYEECYKQPVTTIALGDSNNDFTMLEHADNAILIAKHDGSHASFEIPNLIKSSNPGPIGWNETIIKILNG